MLNLQEVEREIEILEQDETNYTNCSKLAVLYCILDHNKPTEDNKNEYSYGSSEFLQLASKTPIDHVLNVIDEHLEALNIIYPKEYKAIISKIKEGAV